MLQGVTGDYKGLQRITRSYRDLQASKEGYEGVTGDYKRLPRVKRGNTRVNRG